MVNALVLLNVDRDKVNDAWRKSFPKSRAFEVYSVAGRHDLGRGDPGERQRPPCRPGDGTLLRTDGIQKTETLFAFRVYSKHDLDRMFSI